MIATPNPEQKNGYILKTDFDLVAKGITLIKFVHSKYYYKVSEASLLKIKNKYPQIKIKND
jgi:hypothetical protein